MEQVKHGPSRRTSMLARMLGCRHVELADTMPGGSCNEKTVRTTQGKTSKLLTPGTKYSIVSEMVHYPFDLSPDVYVLNVSKLLVGSVSKVEYVDPISAVFLSVQERNVSQF